MLILPKSCFLHTPKTGGTWANRAIQASGIPFEEYTINGDPHVPLKHCPCPEKFKFAFVRHPLEVYRSLWRFKMGRGWDRNNPFDRDCCSGDFQEYVYNFLEKYPGFCNLGFEEFVGPPGAEIEFIGKYENLVEDLITALKMAGEQFDEEAIRNYPPVNVSDRLRFRAEYTPELEKAVKRCERTALERFGYH